MIEKLAVLRNQKNAIIWVDFFVVDDNFFLYVKLNISEGVVWILFFQRKLLVPNFQWFFGFNNTSLT